MKKAAVEITHGTPHDVVQQTADDHNPEQASPRFKAIPYQLSVGILIIVFGFLTVLVVTIYALGYRWEAVVSLLGAAVLESLNLLVKSLVHRPRPSTDLIHVFFNNFVVESVLDSNLAAGCVLYPSCSDRNFADLFR